MVNIVLDSNCCKGCDICISICPRQIFVKSKKRNQLGTSIPDVTHKDQCSECKMCERMCPDGAISVERGTK